MTSVTTTTGPEAFAIPPSSDSDSPARDARLPRDADELEVEDFGHAENLMIIHGLELSGHALVVPPQPVADPLRDLGAFEACVAIAARCKSQYPD